MDVSNKTLAMFLVAAIVVSVAGTMISLNKLGQLGGDFGPTGLATTDQGNVSVVIGSTLSIAISGDDTMNFTCSPGVLDRPVDSEGNDPGSICSAQDSNGLIVINDGNTLANVSVNVTSVGEAHGGAGAAQFLDSASVDTSFISYKVRNVSGAAGCTGNLGNFSSMNGVASASQQYVNFTDIDYIYRVCDGLNFGANNAVNFTIRFLVPQGANSGTEFIHFKFFAQNG